MIEDGAAAADSSSPIISSSFLVSMTYSTELGSIGAIIDISSLSIFN
jgi:hypothetical protein